MTITSNNNNPAIDPADNGTLLGTLRFFFNKMLQDVNGMLPARVIAYDRTINRVQVQPMIAVVTSDGSQVSRAQIASLPVLQLGGGGYMLNFNLVEGDLGWILANDRDISLFLQTYTETQPNTNRIKNFGDSLFIPNILVKEYNIDEEDAEHAVLQSTNGNVRIALWPDRVKITAPEGLEVEGPIAANGGITISGGGDTPLLVTGNLRVVGDITASGSITPFVPP